MQPLPENLRYLVWKKGIQPDEWASQIAEWLGCDRIRAEGLLENDDITSSEHDQIRRILGSPEIDIRIERLLVLYDVDIVLENMHYLLSNLRHGQKKHLAENLSVHPLTLSRWRSGEQRPSKQHLAALSRYFALPEELDLSSDPIFLVPSLLNVVDKKAWLIGQIAASDINTFNLLFPALERIFKSQ